MSCCFGFVGLRFLGTEQMSHVYHEGISGDENWEQKKAAADRGEAQSPFFFLRQWACGIFAVWNR
jgi:hypothetical protein